MKFHICQIWNFCLLKRITESTSVRRFDWAQHKLQKQLFRSTKSGNKKSVTTFAGRI